MAPYIYCKRNQVHILDVRYTVKGIIRAYHFLYNMFLKGEQHVLFVGTKRQIAGIVEESAKRCQMPYVTHRWLGGTLTNFETVRKSLNRLFEIEGWEEDGSIERFTKKERVKIAREKAHLLRNLDGIRNMDRQPACVIIVDPALEITAALEARKVGASAIGLIDSDGSPDLIDIPIPCNDESARAVQIILHKLGDAIIKATEEARPKIEPEALQPEEIKKEGEDEAD
jgi:small subunit ribosomal protein S2